MRECIEICTKESNLGKTYFQTDFSYLFRLVLSKEFKKLNCRHVKSLKSSLLYLLLTNYEAICYVPPMS